MQDLPKNADCRLSGSPYCELLNTNDCKKCFVSKLDSKQQLLVAEDILAIAEALPEDGVEDIMTSCSCALCKNRGEEAEEATRYAQIDMGHKHPTESVGTKLGGDYDRGASMTIPVQLPVCDKCRRSILRMNDLPLALAVAIVAIGMLLVMLEPVRIGLFAYGRIMPLIVFLIFFFSAVIVECVARKLLSNRVERTVNTRTRRIKALAPLVKRGWFGIGEKNGIIPMIFTKERLDSGLLTGENQREVLEAIRALGRSGIKELGEDE